MRRFVRLFFVAGGMSSPALAQTTINGSTMALQSSGAASGTGWTLNSDGYLGTYVTLSQAAPVSFTLNAAGTASNGLSPDMMVSIADSNQTFNVSSSSPTNYSYTTPTLPAGTYFVRTQLDNQTSTQTPSLTLGSMTVSGTGVSVSNQNTTTNALNAATTYASNFRAGPGTITLTNPVNGLHFGAGTQVQVKLVDNAFNFAAAVYGIGTSDAAWINVGSNGANLPPTTSEQINFQKAVVQNFNMIVPSNAGKWSSNEPTQGAVNMNLVDAMTQFANQNNLSMRMHNLIWNTQQPTFVNNLFAANGTSTAANKATLNADITSRINYYVSQNNVPLGTPRAQSYEEMDVLNEAWHGQSAQDNYIGSGALGVSGVANVYSQVATAAKAAGANTRLYTNEYNVLQFSPQSISSTGVASGSDPYANWYLNGVQSLQRAGAPVGGIGAELYVNNVPISASTLQQALQNLSVAKDPNGNTMPLTLSEFGATSSSAPSASTYDTDLTTALTMMYGTPNATTFGYWGGVGGPHYLSGGTESIYALYNSTYQLTTAGQTWQSWMNQYNTNLTLTTDANGNISFNGTYGLYEVIVNGQTYQLDLVKGTANYGLMTAAQSAVWNGAGGNANFSTSANWGGTAVSANAALAFGGNSQLTPNNDSAAGTQYNGITFNAGAGAFVVGGNAINLGGDVVNDSASLETINLNLALQTNVNLNAASGNLAVGGAISGASGITKLGSHTLTLTGPNSYAGGTSVSAGTLVIGAAGALPTNTAVTVNGTSIMRLAASTGVENISFLMIASGAAFDVNNNHVFINYGSTSPAGQIVAYLKSGQQSGWAGTGIISSAAAVNAGYGIAFGDGKDGAAGLVSGTIEISYTLYGDVNQDGSVNGTDFAILAGNFGKDVTGGWEQGDFDYSGVVNGTDFGMLAANFGKSAVGQAIALPASEWHALDAFAAEHGLLADVPEPGAIGLIAVGAGGLLKRRRRV
jgi:autotransporter-associated beta strand protein